MILRVQLDVRRRSRACAGLQQQRFTGQMIEIKAVDQIIGVLIALRERIKVNAVLDEFQH